MTTRPKIAWVGPLAVSEDSGSSISAYFSSVVLPEISAEFEIDLYHNRFESYQSFNTFHFLKLAANHTKDPYDLIFYQLEDGKLHNYVRQYLAVMPGLVLFHDVIFSTDGPEPMLNSSWEDTVSKFHNPQLNWAERGKEYTREGPFGFRETGMCFAALFSSIRGHAEFRRNTQHGLCMKQTPSSYLPFPVDFGKYTKPQRAQSFTRVGFVGSPRIEHRAHKVLQALSELAEGYFLIWMVPDADRARALDMVEEFGVQDRVEFVSEFSAASWQKNIGRIDIAIHTLFSVYSDTGPYLPISLGAGVPVLVSHFGSSEYLPSELVYPIRPGDGEASQIKAAIESARVEDPAISRQRIEFATENFDHNQIAQELKIFINSSSAHLKQASRRWKGLEDSARAEVLSEVRQLFDGADPEDLFNDGSTGWEIECQNCFEELGWSL